MTQENKVDDYYSKMSSSKKEEDKKTSKKPKIVAKKKIVIKKVSPKTKKNDDIKVPTTRKVAHKKSEKKEVKKPFVQKIEVIKKEDQKNQKPTVNKSNRKVTVKTDTKVSGEKNKNAPKAYTGKVSIKKTFTKKPEKSENKPKFSKQKTRGRFKFGMEEKTGFVRSNKIQKTQKEEKKIEDIKQTLVEKKGETIVIGEVLSLKEFSEKIGVVLPKLMAEFMKNGMMVNINSKIDFESASIIAEAFEVKLEKDNSTGASVEDVMTGDISSFLIEEDASKLLPRAPVISIMGHVDHGKTSLLDHIRKAKIAEGEAGGITQSIGAYQVELEQGKITFLDTPGHEAFTIMRARGAKSTDIAILVVAADEGVKPQTIESINHAKEADIPVIVAINKMDKQGANPDHVKGQLAENGLTPEDWGGNTPMIPVSAQTGFGIDELLEMILLVSEMKELKANPERNGIATVIESNLNSSLGPVATVLVNTGVINSGDNMVCGESYGKVKILKNFNNQKVKFAKPSEPVLIVGLDKVVNGGDILQVVSSADTAKEKAIEYKTILDAKKKASASGLDLLMSKIKAGSLKQLKIILKADTKGSLEAMKNSLLKLSTPETTVSIIHSGVGPINEGDILMGQGSEAILVGFGVSVLTTAKSTLDTSGVEFISSEIIYHITERIEKIVTGMLDPKEVEVILGKPKVGGIFFTEKKFMILGLKLNIEGETIENKTQVRIIRKKKMIGHGKIDSLKQGTLEVKQVEGPVECGIKLITNVNIEEGDQLEVYKIEIQK